MWLAADILRYQCLENPIIYTYRPSLRLYHPALSLRNSRIKASKRDQALLETSQCERSYQRRHNARGDVIKLAFVKRKTV